MNLEDRGCSEIYIISIWNTAMTGVAKYTDTAKVGTLQESKKRKVKQTVDENIPQRILNIDKFLAGNQRNFADIKFIVKIPLPICLL